MQSPPIIISHKGLSSSSSGFKHRINLINKLVRDIFNGKKLKIIPYQIFDGLLDFYTNKFNYDIEKWIDSADNIEIKRSSDGYVFLLERGGSANAYSITCFEMQDIVIGLVNRELEFHF